MIRAHAAAIVTLLFPLLIPIKLWAQPATVPVQIINPPELPVPVIRTDRPPIPPAILNFQRQYCSRFGRPRLISEDEDRRLVEYRARLDTIKFPNRLFWIGRLSGGLIATEEHLSTGWGGAVEVTTACGLPTPGGFISEFTPNLDPATRNLYDVSHEEQDFACEFDGEFPVDVLVRVRILEFTGLENDLPVVRPEGDGRVCLTLTSMLPAEAGEN